MPSFDFLFTFTSPVDIDTVDIDDFVIQYGTTTMGSGATISLSYLDDDGTTQVGYTYAPYDQATFTLAADATLGADTVIVLSFPLSDEMLQYGFDFDEDFQVSLSDTNGIQSQLGMTDSDGATYASMTYDIKSLLPLLTNFAYVDSFGTIYPATQTGYAAAKSVEDTFTLNSGSGNDFTYSGFRLRYSFSETISEVTGATGNINYTTPNDATYLDGAGTATLLDYTYGSTAPLPETNTANFDTFVEAGSLVHPANGTTAPDSEWDLLAYIADAGSDNLKIEETDHTYTLIYDDSYISNYSPSLPSLLGGYAASYDPDNKEGATLYKDSDGNPARLASSWTLEQIPIITKAY